MTLAKAPPLRRLLPLAFLAASASTLAQAQAPSFPDAQASDPVTLGWMKGFPPPPDRVIRFADGSSLMFPQLRWSFSNYRRLVPTSNVSRGLAAPKPLPRGERDDIDAVTFRVLGSDRTMTWAQSLARQLHRRHRGAAQGAHRLRALLRRAQAGRPAHRDVGHQVVLRHHRRDAGGRGHAGRQAPRSRSTCRS